MADNRPLLGAHFSISGGVHNAVKEALDYGCNTFQLFTKNSRTWKEKPLPDKDIEKFRTAKAESGIEKIVSHTSYLINIATNDDEKHEKSRISLTEEMRRCQNLGVPYVVLHPGSYTGGTEEDGMRRIVETAKAIFDDPTVDGVRLLLETTAGQGKSIGHTFEQIAELLSGIGAPERTGVCLDTCHIFTAGYDIRTADAYEATMAKFNEIVGLDRLYAVHVNDSKKPYGSHVDRHEHIGKGEIGLTAFECLMNDARLAEIPKILETPAADPKAGDDTDWDRVNLDQLLSLYRGEGS